MRIETALSVINIRNSEQVTTRYEQWVDDATGKHEQRIEVYVVELYNASGQIKPWTNNKLDILA